MSVQINHFFADFWAGSELRFKYHSFERTTETWKLEPAVRPFSRLIYVVDGSAKFYSDEQEIELKPGNAYLIPCSIPSGYYGTDSIELLGFEIYMTMMDGFDFFSSCKRYLSYEFPVEKIRQMASWYMSSDVSQIICLKSAVWESVATFAQMLEQEEKRKIAYSAAVEKAIAYIRKNLSSSLTVKKVSENIFVSLGTLTRKFRKEMGISVSDYIERLVMLKGQRLLLTTDYSIGRISTSLGFCDQFYFSRRFKKLFSISPQTFRRSAMKNQ